MKILFISTAPKGQDEFHPLHSALLTQGFKTISFVSAMEGKESYVVSGLLASNIKDVELEPSTNHHRMDKIEIVFVEQEHAWVAVDKTDTVILLKSEDPAEKIASMIKGYYKVSLR